MPLPKLKYFVQCDEVRNDAGKLSALGIFDTIFSLIFPATHKRFFVLLGFVGAEGQFDVELQISPPSGPGIARANGQLALQSPDQVGNVIFGFENFPLPVQGVYTVSVFMDGDFYTEQSFRVQPPFQKRQRTPEEVAILLNQPDIVKSASAELACDHCKTVYRFQHHLDPAAPAEPGFLKIPPGDVFACAVCGNHIQIRQLRDNLENLVGIPRQWLGGAQGQPPPGAADDDETAQK